ncbi:hypothetical protein APHAL10511_007765 [Amanita phalloides]|nr:hypothetical protein APHAL10511_007765 [Amanita phalloides]
MVDHTPIPGFKNPASPPTDMLNFHKLGVPHFLIPTVQLNFQAEKMKDSFRVMGAPTKTLSMETLNHVLVSPKVIHVPPLPGLMQRELVAAHVEVIMLQQQHGISYKDTTHCLYHTEVGKLAIQDDDCHMMSQLWKWVEKIVEDEEFVDIRFQYPEYANVLQHSYSGWPCLQPS